MEPNLVRKNINYQKKILVIVSVLVISLFMGGSFALLSSSSEVEEAVTFKTGELNMKVTTTGTLSLKGEAPKSYEDGFKTEDITLTLTNTGTLEIGKYEVKLEGDSTTNLENKYIRYSISEDEGKTYLAAKLLSETNNIIYTGYSLKDTKTLKLKIWIDEEAGSNALNKIYNGKIKAELYQKGDSDTAVQVVKSKLISNYSGNKKDFPGGLIAVNTDGDLYHEVNSEEIREYRYSGPSVNNYVTFNDELWRIIGVFSDENGEHLKITRNNILTSDMFPETYIIEGTTYNIKSSDNNSAYRNKQANNSTQNNDWTTSSLQYWLNTKEDETEGVTNKGYLSYLKGNSESMIETTKYYLGTVTDDDSGYIIDTPKEAYANERAVSECSGGKGSSTNTGNYLTFSETPNCRVWANNQATWEGKVTLLYLSDYGFSTINDNWEKQIKEFNTIKSSSWLNLANHQMYEWFLSPSSRFYYTAASWNASGFVYGHYVGNTGIGVRPSLNLKSDIKITSGDGTSSNPYTLTIE